jgi:putative transposase
LLFSPCGVFHFGAAVGNSRRDAGTPSFVSWRDRTGEWNIAYSVGGTADHVHLLLSLPRTISVAKAVQLLKSGSSKWVHDNFSRAKNFAWQEGYGAFSIGVSQRATTVQYIQSQTEHHKRISFADELKKFLAVHGLAE